MRIRGGSAVLTGAVAVVVIGGGPPSAAAQELPRQPTAFSAADLLATPEPAHDTAWLKAYAEQLAQSAATPSPLSDPAEREARIQSHYPVTPKTPLFFAPPNVLARLNLRFGALLERLSLYAPARDAYAHVVGLDQAGLEVWQQLARMRIRTGELEAAEAAFLAAIDAAVPDTPPAQLAKLHNELGELYLLLGSARDAVFSLRLGAELGEPSAREQLLLTRAEYELDPNASTVPTSVPMLWPDPPEPAWKTAAKGVLEPLYAKAPPRVQRALSQAQRHLSAETVLLAIVLGVSTSLLLWRVRRSLGSGDLLVSLHYPAELRGSFSIRIANRRGRWKRSMGSDGSRLDARRRSTRWERHQVSRETHFTRLWRGEWFVTLEGGLRDEASGELVASLFEERSARVAGRQSQQLEFDMHAPGCRVEVSVVWETRPARDATVGVDGLRDSLRYARDGLVILRLQNGHHRIAVGSSDRVVEAEIEIDGFNARQLVIDLADSDEVVFKGCPPAVEPYMHGDVEAAALALEREGQRQRSQLMLARLRRKQGNELKAAEHFEAAGLAREAAELHESLSNHARAAQLFLDAGEPLRAAELFSAAGEWPEAGAAYETAGDHTNAAACFGEAGDHARWADALERDGEAFDAARIALEAGDRARAIQLFQRVPTGDVHFIDACLQLVDSYEEEGHLDLATHKLQDALSATGDGETAPSLRWRLANVLEETGEVERALTVLDELRQSCPTYPNVATRIEALRKRQSANDLPGAEYLARTTEVGGAGMTPTVFLADRRYEVLEEIGRGGMGIVFRAHDKRLDRIVALKQLPQTLRDHPRAVELFLREAQSAARLNHTNVVTVHDTDQQDGTFFIIMELLEGYPLNQILQKKGVLKLRDALRIGVQVCAGLGYAHEQRIVHRDIKTANLFFTRDRVVKIMDFGLAKMLEEVRSASTIVGGTPYYMAPEQGAGGDIDHRADLYAFGVTLFQLLTGVLPFPDGDVTYKHRHLAPPDPRELVPDLPEPLAQLILQLLEKDPEARPASAGEVGRRLQAVL